MADLILSVYESRYPEKVSRRMELYWGSIVVLMVLFGLLICNLRYGESTKLQIILNILSMGTIIYIFIYHFWGKGKYKKSIEDYSTRMEQMETVLYHLDIDTYSKLELVIDEVRARIESEDRKNGWCRVIYCVAIIAIAASLSMFLFCVKDGKIHAQVGSMISLFLILAALLFYIFHGCALMRSQGWKYCWLLNMLLNVKITRF